MLITPVYGCRCQDICRCQTPCLTCLFAGSMSTQVVVPFAERLCHADSTCHVAVIPASQTRSSKAPLTSSLQLSVAVMQLLACTQQKRVWHQLEPRAQDPHAWLALVYCLVDYELLPTNLSIIWQHADVQRELFDSAKSRVSRKFLGRPCTQVSLV